MPLGKSQTKHPAPAGTSACWLGSCSRRRLAPAAYSQELNDAAETVIPIEVLRTILQSMTAVMLGMKAVG